MKEEWNRKFFEDLTSKRTNYKEMIEFCCDGLILNNCILEELTKKDFYFDNYCGTDYDEENDSYVDVYQYYIINDTDAERLAEYTNEIVIYNADLDLYLLCVTHFGTMWQGVRPNWKSVDDYMNEN